MKKIITSIVIILSVILSLSFITSLNNSSKNIFDFFTKEQEVVEDNKEKSYQFVKKVYGGTDGDIYNNFLFMFTSKGQCKVFTADGFGLKCVFDLDKCDVLPPHANSVFFGNEFYHPNDEFPLLYSNIYNNSDEWLGTMNVYRIQRNGYDFTSTLVQVVKVDFTDDSNLWASGVRPYGNFAINKETNKLWAFVSDDLTNSTKFFEFDMPKSNLGDFNGTLGCNVYKLKYEDVTDMFNTIYFRFMQGCTIVDNKLISTEGFTNDTTNIPTIRVVDLKTHKIDSTNLVDTFGWNNEPEFITYYNNNLYYISTDSKIYILENFI